MKMAAILKSALHTYATRSPDSIRIKIPDHYFDEFAAILSDLEKLNDMYYDEKYKLPGMTQEAVYLDDFVEYYWTTFPPRV